MERSSRKLDHGQEMLEESQNVGVTILNDLALQRETISRARNRVSTMVITLGVLSLLDVELHVLYS